MNTAKNSKIEAILPLSEMQEGILIHHLHSQWDEGFLHVEFGIKGQLDKVAFVKAWDMVIARHEILRTTVHWENIEKPLQVIHPGATAEWHYNDLKHLKSDEQKEKITLQKKENRAKGTDFKKNPSNKFHLITLAENSHYFLWPCHHLLLDGWSGSNIIRDVLAYYDAICKNEILDLGALPPLKSYYAWLKKKDPLETSKFWEQYFEGFQQVCLFNTAGLANDPSNKSVKKIRLTAEVSQALNSLAQKSKLSLNTLIQGAWTLLLSAYFSNDDIIFGSVISGRSNDFPNMELLCGVFTNILPIRGNVIANMRLDEWLSQYQTKQLSALKHGHVSQNEISDLLKEATKNNLFDSIVIFENYPSKKVQSGDIEIQGFKSGVTSNYPLSLMVLPHAEIVFTFIFQNDQISLETRNWLSENLTMLLNTIIDKPRATIQEIIGRIESPTFSINTSSDLAESSSKTTFVAPTNALESELAAIWADVLGNKEIGVNDNYFELGGKSLMALKMIARINKQLDTKLPVTALLFHPTIAGLTQEIKENKAPEKKKAWDYLIPLKPEGSKSPVFCIHAGEGHILFYKKMSMLLHKERPVYLVQPKGIHGDGPMHDNIEEMSRDYIAEISQIPDVKTYNLVFYCYSAIVVEMAKQLQQMGKSVNLMVIDSWGGSQPNLQRRTFKKRMSNYFKSFSQSPLLSIKTSLVYRFRQRLLPLYLKIRNDKTLEHLRKVRLHLRTIYYRYKWTKFNAPLVLILAEMEHPKLKTAKVASWEYWAQSALKVHYTSGDHFSIFEEPHVKNLADIIEEESV